MVFSSMLLSASTLISSSLCLLSFSVHFKASLAFSLSLGYHTSLEYNSVYLEEQARAAVSFGYISHRKTQEKTPSLNH